MRCLLLVAVVLALVAQELRAEPVPVTCTIEQDGETASVMLANPFGYEASCLASCKFSTAVYDDNPQIICVKPVPARKEVQMCILKAADNKLLKLTSAMADCRRP